MNLAKISLPTVEGIYPRERLFRRLDQARSRPVIFVTAPPGAGKTSLVASYLKDRNLSGLWYQVDASDADVASFFYYMGLAVKSATRGRKKPLPLLTPEYLQGIKAFTFRYFEELFRRLHPRPASSSKGSFLIVLDNFQEVPEATLFQEIVKDGISRIPGGENIIIISRNESPSLFAPLRANRRMEVIGWDDLRLDLKETEGIVRMLRHERLPRKLLHRMHRRADGWAAGLVLIAEGSAAEIPESPAQRHLLPKEIFDYFAGEIFEKAGTETRSFLLKTAFFPTFTAHMAGELARNPEATRILSDLNERNYFTQRHASGPPVYRYHGLFREFLLERAGQAYPVEDLLRIRHHAARLCEEAGRIEDAVELFLQGGAWDDATRLILRQAPTMVAQGRGNTLAGWIETMPDSRIQREPYLLFWMGICHLPLAPPLARENLEKAFRLFEAQQDSVGAYFAWSGIVNSHLSEWDDFTALDPWIDWLDRRLSDGSALPSAVSARVAVSMMWALTYRRPGHPDIGAWVDRALSVSQSDPDPNLRAQACLCLSPYCYFMGEHGPSLLLAVEGQRNARLPGVSPLSLIGMKFLEITRHFVTAAPGSSSRLMEESLAMAEKTGVHGYDSMLYSYAACDFLARGDFAQARELLGKMETTLKVSPRCARGHYHYIAAWYHLLLDDLPNAAAHVENAVPIAIETGMRFGEGLGRILLAYVLQKQGESTRAVEQIGMARTIGREAKSSLFEWLCGLADAWIAFGTGQETSGLDSLRKAMAVGRAKGFLNSEGWLPSVMAELCRKALESGIEVEYARDLVRKRRLMPEPPPYDCEEWPWPLKIFTLGEFRIVKDGKRLQYPVRAPRALLALFKAIISFGGGGVKEEHLVDALQPEAAGDTAHHTYKTTLHRLRRLIGDERALVVREGRVSLDRRYCWVDAFAFEFLVEKAKPLWGEHRWQRDASADGEKIADKALSLYRGRFLGEEAVESWAVACQERLGAKFIRTVMWRGGAFERSGQWERAVECYRRGLEVDELAEGLHQRLIASYLSLDRRAEAVAAYNRCRKVLRSALGVDPSRRTQEILGILKEKA